MNLILLGAPGAGKGTQGVRLSQQLDLPKVATGDLLRAAVRDGTPLGEQASSYMDSGLLVPDAVILGLIGEVLESPQMAGGLIMDGFPRTVGQAEAVDRLLQKRGAQVDHVLTFEVPEEQLVERLLGRANTEGRRDDRREAINRRLAVYREQTAPLLAFYRHRDVLREIDGVGCIEEVERRVLAAIGR